MRIGMLCHNYPPHPGGLEVMVQSLSRGLAGRHEVVVITSAWQGARGVSHEDGLTVHRIPSLHSSEDFGVPYPMPLGPGIAGAIEALKSVDLLHAHGALYPTSILAATLAARRKVPLVLTEHVGFVEYKNPAINAIERTAWNTVGDRIVRASGAVATYNGRVQRWLEERFPGRRVRYIGNGVDSVTFRPLSEEERSARRREFGLPSDKPLVLYAGRAAEKKNLDVVLRMPREEFHLVLCGAKRDLQEPNLTDLGIIPHQRMPALFGCADLMVHASTGEGFPLAMQEGLAAGLPLVVYWDEGYGGWLDRNVVAACDRLDDLGTTVSVLAKDAPRRRALSEAGRNWALENWSWENTVRTYEAVYSELKEISRNAA